VRLSLTYCGGVKAILGVWYKILWIGGRWKCFKRIVDFTADSTRLSDFGF